MDLASYLLKPVQRMGKYALLLQQLMKAVTNIQGPALQEIFEDMEELQKAEEMVRFQLRHGNDLLAMDSLRDCDVSPCELRKFNSMLNFHFVYYSTRSMSKNKDVYCVKASFSFGKDAAAKSHCVKYSFSKNWFCLAKPVDFRITKISTFTSTKTA